MRAKEDSDQNVPPDADEGKEEGCDRWLVGTQHQPLDVGTRIKIIKRIART